MLYAYVQTNDLFTINEERQDSFIREQMNKHQVRTLLKTEGLPILRPCGAPQVRREGVQDAAERPRVYLLSRAHQDHSSVSTNHYC